MKKTIITLFLIAFNLSYSQSGKIYPLESEIKIGETNTFIYQAPKGVEIPEKSVVIILNQSKKTIVNLIKEKKTYQFSYDVPENTETIILGIANSDKKVYENNFEKAYVIHVSDNTESEKGYNILNYLSNYKLMYFNLNVKLSDQERVVLYEEAFSLDPNLKKGASYLGYIYAKAISNSINPPQEVIDYIDDLQIKGDEKSLTYAKQLYTLIGMKSERERMSLLIKLKYPNGESARDIFKSEFNKQKEKTEGFILESLKEYTIKFKDTTVGAKDPFYSELLKIYLNKRDTLNLRKCENKIDVKVYISRAYNSYAWKLSGAGLSNSGTDLDFAEFISKKALKFTEYSMANPELHGGHDLQDYYNNYKDTYALILYKLGKYELAFKYQEDIRKLHALETSGKERYATYAQKAKGLEFAKDYIEAELKTGIDSKYLVNQLQEIYNSLNLSNENFKEIKETSQKLAKEKAQDEIIKKYGRIEAFDFNLINLKGEIIKLSDYKGKLVVLDFWATWCGPCKASFPNMQELVNKYKDKNVEFFFIDSFERDENQVNKEKVLKYITDNGFNFNVLFDFDDKTAKNYKVGLIPMKIVIDKNGEVISLNTTEANLDALIQENIN